VEWTRFGGATTSEAFDLAICAILSILSLPFVGAFDMKMSAVGNLANIVAAFSLSACWLGVSYHLDRVAYVGYALAAIGRASITIMFLHALFLVHGAALIGIGICLRLSH